MQASLLKMKYAKEMKNLDAACEAAMTQIKEKRYDEALRDEGRCNIFSIWHCFLQETVQGGWREILNWL